MLLTGETMILARLYLGTVSSFIYVVCVLQGSTAEPVQHLFTHHSQSRASVNSPPSPPLADSALRLILTCTVNGLTRGYVCHCFHAIIFMFLFVLSVKYTEWLKKIQTLSDKN